MILNWLRDKTPNEAYDAYAVLVDQARNPVFYTTFSVPDTVDGRFDMIVMHVVLLFRRLHREGDEPIQFGQHVFDIFVKDMDRSLREMGVSDTSVPKKMKKIGESYFGRSEAYQAALDADDMAALSAAIERNIFADQDVPDAQPASGAADLLAGYMKAADEMLGTQTFADLMAGQVDWPVPGSPAESGHGC